MRVSLITVSVVLVVGFCAGSSAAGATPFGVLVFTKTADYRHDSIPAAIAAVEQLGVANGFAVDATEDASVFTDSNLTRYAVVMFLLTTGDVLDPDQQAAFMRYVERGGGFVGVHSAADTEHDWPWYGGLVGAYFESHPAIQQATVDVVDRNTPSTIHLPARWIRTDEWYEFQTDPSSSVTVLAKLDETTYAPDAPMGASHPIAWQHVFDGGRSWYTGGGHTAQSYLEPLFMEHVLGGILWAAGYDLPAFSSLATRVVRGRLQLTVAHPRCFRCTLQLRVHAGTRIETTTVDASGTRTVVRTARLQPGLHPYSVVLTEKPLAAHATRRGWIRVG